MGIRLHRARAPHAAGTGDVLHRTGTSPRIPEHDHDELCRVRARHGAVGAVRLLAGL